MPGEDQNAEDVTPRKKRGAGMYVIIGAAVLLVILGVSLFAGGDDKANGSPNGGNTNTPITIPELKSAVDSLTATVEGFGGRITLLETQIVGLVAPTVTRADIDNLQASLNSLDARLAELNATVDDMIDTWGGDGNETEYWGEISRWDFDSLRILGCTDNYRFDVVSKSPSRIEDEDLYEITVEITNENTVVPTGVNDTYPGNITPTDITNAAIALNHELEIVMSPRDYCMVDEDLTYLDSDSYPYLNWDSDFVTRTREGQEVCRRITFASEKYDFGSLLSGESLELDLVLELYYA